MLGSAASGSQGGGESERRVWSLELWRGEFIDQRAHARNGSAGKSPPATLPISCVSSLQGSASLRRMRHLSAFLCKGSAHLLPLNCGVFLFSFYCDLSSVCSSRVCLASTLGQTLSQMQRGEPPEISSVCSLRQRVAEWTGADGA